MHITECHMTMLEISLHAHQGSSRSTARITGDAARVLPSQDTRVFTKSTARQGGLQAVHVSQRETGHARRSQDGKTRRRPLAEGRPWRGPLHHTPTWGQSWSEPSERDDHAHAATSLARFYQCLSLTLPSPPRRAHASLPAHLLRTSRRIQLFVNRHRPSCVGRERPGGR